MLVKSAGEKGTRAFFVLSFFQFARFEKYLYVPKWATTKQQHGRRESHN